MKALILGIDGYIGWPLALRYLSMGYDVSGADNFFTRRRVKEVDSESVFPIAPISRRIQEAEKAFGKRIRFYRGDVSGRKFLFDLIKEEKPDVIVHLAEQRSAPYSMIGLKQASETMTKNVISTLNLIYAVKDIVPKAHILKLGTMGEYGTPNIDIPEGFFEIEYNGRKDTLPFPKNAGSWYHWTKVHDSNNLMFANRIWNLRITDVMQGVVYGTRIREITSNGLRTRFDIDEVWGTALNRFCAQATIGIPITPYGKGGQTRGFLSLEDSITCLSLATEHPPEDGEYRVFNQFDQHYSVNQLASYVKEVYEKQYGKEAVIDHVPNPRIEKEEHYYNPVSVKLRSLGYKPSGDLRTDLGKILEDLQPVKERIKSLKSVIVPRTFWQKSSGL
ncbi:MAG: UDP-sulfoquinovose synthase [Thermoplasmataceae archaeon]|jgi:nucleoside-diphosphate-sugar epimerase